ncbi:spidroin-1-like [Iris pallida]|uniref:Spidroin-1-like n=1 Tax=Iris pallida TaxID=29817 RepID=A0AAX6EGP8_IRIPA|nr:spidroin-1-like [Iris pallida]
MVPGSLWEFGISDVVFFRDFRKSPVNCFGFPKYFGNGFWYVLVLRKFSGTCCDLWIWNRTSETISGRPDYSVDCCGYFIYIKCGFFLWFGTCRNYRCQFSSFWVDQKQRRCCPFFRKS